MSHRPGRQTNGVRGFRSIRRKDGVEAIMADTMMNKIIRRGIQYFCAIGASVSVAIAAAAAEVPFVVALRGRAPASLSPVDAYTTNDLAVVSEIMEGLVKFNADSPTKPPELNLASWQSAIDSLTYVFDIRDDVYFHPFPKHPHDKLTAADVKFSLDTAKTSRIRLKDRISNIDTIEVHGNTVKITLKRPMKDFIAVLATSAGYITSKRYYDSLGSTAEARAQAFARAPIGTGPFRLLSPIDPHSTSITLGRFRGYRDKQWAKSTRTLITVTFRFYEDARAILDDLQAGKVMLTSLPLTEFGLGGDFRDNGSFVRLEPPFLAVLAVNIRRGRLRDERIRQLLNAAVNTPEIAKMCHTDVKGLPVGYRKYMEIPQAYLDPAQRVPVTTFLADPAIRSTLDALRKAGGLKILAPQRPDQMMDRILDRITIDFKQNLDLKVTVKKVPSVSSGSITEEQPDLIYREWTPDTPWEYADLSIVEPLFNSKSLNNYGGWADKQVDADFDQLHAINDQGTTENIYKDVQERLRRGAPLIWLPIVRGMTLFLHKDYRAYYGDPKTKSTSTLLFYTSMLKDIRKVH
jgi:ABC-type transport system substrate-binding protein